MKIYPHNENLDKRLAKVDGQVKKGQIPYSSKVIPVEKAMEGRQWVLPTAQALKLLNNCRTFALADCACRTAYQRCDAPLKTCFYVNDVAEKAIAKGEAEQVSLEQARQVIKLANKHGLVNLTFYNPDQHFFALCSCCPCCCHDLQFFASYQRPDLVARADYIARTDFDECSLCGACVDRCHFEARRLEDGRLIYEPEKCYGCGLCVDTCPTGATVMELVAGDA